MPRFRWTDAEIRASRCAEDEAKWFYGLTFDPFPRIVEIFPGGWGPPGSGGGYARAWPITPRAWVMALRDVWRTSRLKRHYLLMDEV